MDKCNLSGQHRYSCAPQGVSYGNANPASSIWILARPCWAIIGWTEGISRWLRASANHIAPLAHWLAERLNPLTHLHCQPMSAQLLPPCCQNDIYLSFHWGEQLLLGGETPSQTPMDMLINIFFFGGGGETPPTPPPPWICSLLSFF